ncbi:MAG TPA: DinB family protein [Phycisphaerales bacterium]|nr:DinB family protein [Phycisphaerales bacterium]
MTATAANPQAVSGYFLSCLARTLGYAEALVRDIPADQFAHMPHPQMNHPAFIMGHLSIYPDRLLKMVGRAELVREISGYADLFSAAAKCLDQPGLYPPKDEIVGYYMERYRTIRDVVAQLPDEVFTRENPMEGRLKELFPTIGGAVNFMLNNHNMMHLGQISAWRRAVGLGPAV